MREYVRLIADGDREKAKTSAVPFFLGRTAREASAIALLMLVAESLNMSPPLPTPTSRLMFAVALGAALALKSLWINRLEAPDPLHGA